MLPDHYATLGIALSSRPAAIRAAYVELMRRYHPDINPSAAAAVRVRAITAAYAVLGVPDRRAVYDLERAKLLAAQSFVFQPERPQWRLTPLHAAFFGIAGIVLLLPLLISPPLIPPERSGPRLSVGAHQNAVLLEQDEVAPKWNLAALRAADGVTDIISFSDERPIVSPLPGVAQMSRQTADQLDAPAAPENGARNERAKVVEQMSSPAPPSEAAVAHAQGIQPIKPAWQRPLPPMKPAWQRPLPPVNH